MLKVRATSNMIYNCQFQMYICKESIAEGYLGRNLYCNCDPRNPVHICEVSSQWRW